MNETIMKSKKIKRLFTAVVILFPILNSAHIGNLNFGFGDLFLVLTYLLITLLYSCSKKFNFNKTNILFLGFLIYLGGISLFNCLANSKFEFSSMLTPYIRYVFYGLIIFNNKNFIDIDFGVKFYVNVCLIETIYGLIQFLMTLTTGIALPYVLPFTTMEYGSYGADYNLQLLYTLQYIDGIRFVGFFPEASHFAQYTILAIVFLLYKKNRGKLDIIKLVMISLGIILTKSSVGIIAYLFVITYYFVTTKHISKKEFITRFTLIIVFVGLFVIIQNRLDIFGFIQERFRRISEKQYAVSGNLRLLRGYIVYNEFPLFFKIFGIGSGNYANFVEGYNIRTFFDLTMDRTNEYMNAFSLLLIRTGIAGTVLYTIFSIKFFKNCLSYKRSYSLFGLNFFSQKIYSFHHFMFCICGL